MKVGNRLFIAVLPAVFGLVLVAALGYWGRYEHAVPEIVVIIAAVAALLSLVFAWRNTHYVVARVERLAGLRIPRDAGASTDPAVVARQALRDLGMGDAARRGAHGAGDELDAIEATVAGLSSAVASGRELSGHGKPFLDVHGHVEGNRALVRHRLDAALAAVADGPRTALEITPAVHDEPLTERNAGWWLPETLCYLQHLELRGLVARESDAGVERWAGALSA